MNERRGIPADPLAGLARPPVPPELRARVLAASRAALLVGPYRPQAEAAALPLSRWASGADDELAAIGRLPRLDPDARPLGAHDAEPSARSLPSNPEPPKENRT